MNNDFSSSGAAADLPASATEANDNTAESITSGLEDGRTIAQNRLQAVSQKKNELLAHLLDNLDSIIYMELAVLYYMDNSLFRFLIRAINQIMFLTPKPAFLPPAPQKRPYLGAIFAPNIICIVLHILTAHSSASEEMRGYLHGGVILDLIGQKGPTSKMHVVILDVLVWVMQCVMLTVILEKERIVKLLADLNGGVRIEVAAGEENSPAASYHAQDVDAEERGVLRHGLTNTGDIELVELPPSNTTPVNNVSEEQERFLAETTTSAPEHSTTDDVNLHPLDILYTRDTKIATFHVLPALKNQWQDYGNTSGSALQTVGFSAEFARVAASRRLGAASQRLQQQVDALGVAQR